MAQDEIFDPRSSEGQGFLCNPIFRVVGTWIWFFAGAFLTLLIILGIMGVGFSEMAQVLGEQRHLTLYIELVSVGLFPLVISFLCGDDFVEYGFRQSGIERSLVYSIVYVGVMYLIGYLMTGQIMSDDRAVLSLGFPLNLWYGLGGVLVLSLIHI